MIMKEKFHLREKKKIVIHYFTSLSHAFKNKKKKKKRRSKEELEKIMLIIK